MRGKRIDLICIVVTALALAAALALFSYAIIHRDDSLKTSEVSEGISTEYVNKIFDDSFVHVIDISISDLNWDYMVENASDEVYVLCDALIDGEEIENVALRPKGNSSLASIAAMGNERFSFKLEFDHYTKGNTYYGLDKLALNNLGQDKSCMKDYLAYHMMKEEGIAAPLCSYTLLRVNGEDFGLYLAVEAVEDSFCYRNYGEDYGNLYRPDAFAIEAIGPDDFMGLEESGIFDGLENSKEGTRVDVLGAVINRAFEDAATEVATSAMNYSGDSLKDYDIVFDTSVFKVKNSDKKAFVDAVKRLNSSDWETALDTETVMRYFVVHSFVNNYDSYSGVFVHNFFVRENEGKLSMIPWDYNLAFGAFSVESAVECFFGGTDYEVEMKMGEAMSADQSFVNYPIDEPVYNIAIESRPMLSCWLSDEGYRELYHEYYKEFLDSYFESGRFEEEYEKLYGQIKPYVEEGLTFYDTETFEEGAKNLRGYCLLRTQSIEGQLAGEIPTDIKGQEEKYSSLIKTDDINLGKTIDFEGLAFGVTSEDIVAILDAIAGSHEHNVDGVQASLKEAGEDRSALKEIIKRVIGSSELLRNAIGLSLAPFLELVFAIILLLCANKLIKKYRRS